MDSEKKVMRIGQISSEGSQSGTVYFEGGYRPQLHPVHMDTQSDKYLFADKISYCIDANYWKGTTVENFFKKHRRQLVIEK